jgi:hypothetical protein
VHFFAIVRVGIDDGMYVSPNAGLGADSKFSGRQPDEFGSMDEVAPIRDAISHLRLC